MFSNRFHYEIKYKIDTLDLIYNDYVNGENLINDNIGFDSLQFQNKLYNYEFDNLKQMNILIENKIYGEYYSLLIMMAKIKEIIKEKI